LPSEQEANNPTTIGTESGRVALQRRHNKRTDHVHDIPFGERAEVTCPDCGESITVGIYGNTTACSYSRCWTWNCDAYHKLRRDRDAETDDEQSNKTVQTKLVTDGGQAGDDGGRDRREDPSACWTGGVHTGAFGDEYCDPCAREISVKPPMQRCVGCGRDAPGEEMKTIDVSPDDEYYPEIRHLCRSCSGGEHGGA
jgi:hypothetical protein